MIWLILAALAVAVIAYIVFPGFRAAVDGWKTRTAALATMLLGAADFLDPGTVSTALGLDAKGKAITVIAIGLLFLVLREFTSKPGSMAKK